MIRQSLALLVCAALALPGCATARLARANVGAVQTRVAPTDPSLMAAYARQLPAGSRVRVETTGGRTVRGTLMRADEDQIVIQRHTRVPVPPEAIPIPDIARITPETGSSNGKLMAIGAAIGAGAAIGVVWLIAFLAFGD